MSWLMSVLLPTPEPPTKQCVCPGTNIRRSSSSPSCVTLLKVSTGASIPAARISARCASTTSGATRSVFVNSTHGSAPPSRTMTR